MFSNSRDIWNVVFYDEITLINKLNYFGVEIYNFQKIDKYKYYFETKRSNRKIIKNNFKDSKLISRKGLFNYVEALFGKTTFICITIATLLMHNVSLRVWDINIVGDYEEIEEELLNKLKENNILISDYYPSKDKLKEIENSMSLYFSKEIEFLELRRKGSLISLRYQKRRKTIELENKRSSLYATKDGMIRYFDIASGVKQVNEYDYVRKGDLLISDVVISNNGDTINVGTLGAVYANTFYVIEVNVNCNECDESSIFSLMLDKAKVKISSYLSNKEKIEVERVLDYKIEANNGYMKVYYMLLEDITI